MATSHHDGVTPTARVAESQLLLRARAQAALPIALLSSSAPPVHLRAQRANEA